MISGYFKLRNTSERDTSEGEILYLLNNGCTEVVEEQCETNCRAKLQELIKNLAAGDTLMIRSLDQVVESFDEALEFIRFLVDKDVILKIINMGTFDNTAHGQMLLGIFKLLVGFNEFNDKINFNKNYEKENIVSNNKGKKIRYKKFTKKQLDIAMALLEVNGGKYTYDEVAKQTQISKSTLLRALNKLREEKEYV